MTERTTTTIEPSLTTQLGFDYGQLAGDDWQFVQDARDQIRRLGKQTVENIVEIGRLLIEVKERLPHGQWLPWLHAEFAWSETTARRFMDSHVLFKSAKLEDLPRLLELPPSAVAEIAASSTPRSARREILDQVAAGKTPTTAQVRETVRRHKPTPKPKTVDGDRPPELKRVEPPKPELVEGRDYRLVEDQYGFKHREPISAEPIPSKQQSQIGYAVETLVRAIVNDPTVVADLEAVIADHEKTRAEAVADGDADDVAWHDLALSVLRHVVSLATGGGESARTPEQLDVEEAIAEKPAQPVPSNGGEWAARGAAIREARIAKGMNSKQLAKQAGVAPNIVSMVELGRLTKTGSPACGKPAIGKLEAALGIGEQRLHREQSGP
jgi:hypothetical protein